MHRFHPIHALLFAAALLAAAPAHGRATTSATLADLRIELTDLAPSDGIPPSLTLDSQDYSDVGVMAPSDVDFHASRGDSAFGAVSISREVDGSGGDASLSGDPLGAGATLTASAFAEHGAGATSFADVGGPPSALDMGAFVLGPHSQVTFSGQATLDWDVSDAHRSTYAAVSLAFMRLIDGQQHWSNPVGASVSYDGFGDLAGTLSAPVDQSFSNTSDVPEVVIFSLGVGAFAIDAQIDAFPIDEPAGAALWLAGAAIVSWAARRRRF